VVDLHAHILPELDDGPASVSEAIEMCRRAAEDGTTVIVATPHMLNGVHEVRREDVLKGVEQLQKHLDEAQIRLRILPGADVHAEPDICQRVRSGQVMTMADGGKYLMLDLGEEIVPPRIEEALFALHLEGITPILSHPERNLAVQEDPEALVRLVGAGNLAQVTAGSLTGEFGPRAARSARTLLERGLVHLVASDTHSPSRRPPGLSRAREAVARMVGEAQAAEIFDHRPSQIIAGRAVSVPEPVPTRRASGWWSAWSCRRK